MTLLEAEAISRRLPGGPVLLSDATLAIAGGEFVAITGPSGSGKSSLLYLLGLLDRPSSGRIRLQGQDTTGLPGDALAALRLARFGFVFQFHFLLPEFTALDNVAIPIRRLAQCGRAEARDKAQGILAGLGLGGDSGKTPDQLSGGMRQRVAIARALANDPALLLADEPTGNLDTKNAAAVFDIFAGLAQESGRAVVVVTHDAELAKRATRRIHLVDGRIVSDEAQG